MIIFLFVLNFHYASVAYCIDNALEKEEDKQAYYAKFYPKS
jgi:hypothetical protein